MPSNAAILFDQYGNPLVGYGNAAMPTQQPAILTAGSDYTATPKAQLPRVDGAGQQYAVPVATNGTPLPVQIGASAANPYNMYGQVSLAWSPTTQSFVPFQVDATGAGVVRQSLAATFATNAQAVTGTTAGRSIISFYNAGPMVQRILALYAFCPPQLITSGSGGLLGSSTSTSYTQILFSAYRTTGHSGGTVATPVAHDPVDTLDTGFSVRVNGAAVTGESATSIMAWDAAYDGTFNVAQRQDQNIKVLTIPPNSGLHVKCLTALSSSVTFLLRIVSAQNTA